MGTLFSLKSEERHFFPSENEILPSFGLSARRTLGSHPREPRAGSWILARSSRESLCLEIWLPYSTRLQRQPVLLRRFYAPEEVGHEVRSLRRRLGSSASKTTRGRRKMGHGSHH